LTTLTVSKVVTNSGVRRNRSHVMTAALALCVMWLQHAQAQPPPRSVQPLDPLTASERRQAESIAREDPRVKELLGGGRTRLVYVDFVAIKSGELSGPDSPEPLRTIGRHADVVFYRYDDNHGIRAVVDLEAQRVQQAERIDSAEVPLTPEELEEGLALALKQDDVRALLGSDASRYSVDRGRPSSRRADSRVVRALRVIATAESDPCWQHRCVQLMFRRGDVYLIDTVMVDLTAQQARVERGQQ
jgi:hypothetical protein